MIIFAKYLKKNKMKKERNKDAQIRLFELVKQRILKKDNYVEVMDSKKIIFLVIIGLFFSSCEKPNPDFHNEIGIFNSTGDILIFSEYKSWDFYQPIYPGYALMCLTKLPISEELYLVYEKNNIKFRVFKLACDTCESIEIRYSDRYYRIEPEPRVEWVPPFVSLPDSIHSFYNLNSWVIEKGGNKNEYDKAVFTIRKKDLEKPK